MVGEEVVFYTQYPKRFSIDLGCGLCVDLEVEVMESEARLWNGVTMLAVAWWTVLAVAG